MNLLKTSLLNGIGVFIKMLSALVLNKVFAVTVGPAGYTVIGQLQNAVTIITNVGAGAINSGVIKYTAQYTGDESNQHTVWQTAFRLSAIMSMSVGLLIALASVPLARFFLSDRAYAFVFILFGLCLPAIVFNSFLIAVLNGRKEISRLVLCNCAGSVVALLLTGLLTLFFGLPGALAALGVNQAASLATTWFICRRISWLSRRSLLGPLRADIAKMLLRFATMILVSAIAAPCAQIAVRTFLTHHLGATQTGYWQAAWKIGEIYLMLLTTTLATYFLPRFSELTEPAAVRKELMHAAALLLPLLAIGLFLVYFTRPYWISLLFSPEFTGLEKVLPVQLLGDFFKMIGWAFGYLAMAKAMTRVFITGELIAAVGFYLLTASLVPVLGLAGVAAAHALINVLYAALMFACLKKSRVI